MGDSPVEGGEVETEVDEGDVVAIALCGFLFCVIVGIVMMQRNKMQRNMTGERLTGAAEELRGAQAVGAPSATGSSLVTKSGSHVVDLTGGMEAPAPVAEPAAAQPASVLSKYSGEIVL